MNEERRMYHELREAIQALPVDTRERVLLCLRQRAEWRREALEKSLQSNTCVQE